MCQNEGILDNETCVCDCAGGFSGDNCESECIVRRLAPVNVLHNYMLLVIRSTPKCVSSSLLLKSLEHRAPVQ